jgi:dihydrolipoamide dehydrogenase
LYDLCILGAGPAGFAAAIRAHDLGKRVVLVERDRPGGAGIHNGALSSKTLWEMSKDYATARRTDRGYRARDIELSYPDVIEAVRLATAERQGLLERQLAAFAEPAPSGASIRLLRGTGRFVTPHELLVERRDGTSERIEAAFFLVATGSRPRMLPGIEADGKRVVTSDHLEALPDFPRVLVVLGAGVVGCEYATMFSRFGRTAVHLLDREPRILPFEDEDVSLCVSRSFREQGMSIHHETRLEQVTLLPDGVNCTLSSPRGTEELVASHLLLSIGRVPNTDQLGLEEIGVELLPNRAIATRDTVTSVPHIYAAGDTTADVALANVAELEGRHAVERMFGVAPIPLRYDALSSILFLSPEVAAVGLNEQQARKQGLRYRVATVDNRMVARNVAMRSTRGFVKLLATPEGRLLGLRVVGPQASSTIQGVAFLIDRGGTLEDIDLCIHPHPAIPEGVQECARLLLGRSVHKPSVHGDAMRVAEG